MDGFSIVYQHIEATTTKTTEIINSRLLVFNVSLLLPLSAVFDSNRHTSLI